MILPDFKAFPRTGRVLGLDWGARRTGVAVSDATREFVFTRPAIVTARFDVADWAHAVAAVTWDERVAGIVIGRPVHSDGTVSETFSDVLNAANALDKIIELPIVFIDENLTSVAAQEQMGRMRVVDVKQRLDSESARVILENAIAVMQRMHN